MIIYSRPVLSNNLIFHVNKVTESSWEGHIVTGTNICHVKCRQDEFMQGPQQCSFEKRQAMSLYTCVVLYSGL